MIGVEMAAQPDPQRQRLRKTALNVDTGEIVPMTTADQVLACGQSRIEVPVSIHYRGGMARGSGLNDQWIQEARSSPHFVRLNRRLLSQAPHRRQNRPAAHRSG
jgi:hypothetical protein